MSYYSNFPLTTLPAATVQILKLQKPKDSTLPCILMKWSASIALCKNIIYDNEFSRHWLTEVSGNFLLL